MDGVRLGRGGAAGIAASVCLLAGAFCQTTARADFPYPAGSTPPYKLSPGTVPNDYGDWKLTATPENPPPAAKPTIETQQDELCGVRGMSVVDSATTQPTASNPVDASCVAGQPVHTAWTVTTGRPDVVIDVLDSGIKWNDSGAMNDLRKKVHLNQGELPAPQHDLATGIGGEDCSKYHDASGGNYDVNGDGVFNVLDYACDSRVKAVVDGGSARHQFRHGPAGVLTPEDLVLAFSDGVDNDHNGYVDDIAGWNFVDDNNNPYDDVQYGHGTGEARDSNAEANNGGDLGTCPDCMVTPLRVGESFIADSNRFAQAVLYATDNGASVVQEALGTLNESYFTRQAIEYAYHHGVTVIASAADEAAEHHNQPGTLPDAIVVNSVRQYDSTFTSEPPSYLQFNGCTNFSTRVVVAVPSDSCSSEATGKSAGVAGLIYSAALNAHDAHTLAASGDCRRVDGSPCVITPNEVRQLMGSGGIGSNAPADGGSGQADDVHFADTQQSCPADGPTCTDPNSNSVFNADQNGGVVGPLPKTTRYHATKGFDEFYGYGRLNAFKAVSAADAAKIPPEAEITSPDWFQQIDPNQSTVDVGGYVNARAAYKCTVSVAPGGQPNNATDFRQASSSWCDGTTSHTSPFTGTLGTINVATLKSYFPSGNPTSWGGNENGGVPQTSNGRPNTMPYAFTVRVVVTTSGATPMSGEDRRQLWLHRDQDVAAGFPKELQTDGDSAPLLVDVDGDNRNELVVATSDGWIHAYRSDGSEVPGWPVHTDPLPLHTGAAAYSELGTGHYGAVLGALAAGDLFHDGRIEIVADDNDGNVYAWDGAGNRVFHQQSNANFSGAAIGFQTVRQGPRDRTERGFLASPVLADLEGHGQLDIVAAGDDRHVYAWRPDGSSLSGFPRILVDPDKVASIDPTTNKVTFNSNASANPGIDEDQGKIIDTPAVAHLDGPGHPPSIVVGTNEEYAVNTGDEGPINASGVSSASLGVIGTTGVLNFANGRVYAINSNGTLRAGWPHKIGIIDRGLLPDVGEGINGSPVVAPVTCPSGGGGMKAGVTPDAGPAYILNADGTSCYGSSSGQDNTLETDASAGPGSDKPDYAAVGYPAFGSFDGSTISFFAPVTGLTRALDVVAPEYQGGQDYIGAWDPTKPSKQFLPGYPAEVNDLQFLTGQVVGQATASSGQDVIGGTASLDLAAFDSSGNPASAAWPKLTGDWTVATPTLGSFGTLDTDAAAHKVVVSITRMGTLSVYTTPAPACSPSSSPRFHHDDANSGDYTRDAVPPGVPVGATVTGRALSFTAPGSDLLCGRAQSYQVATSNSPITAQSFASATPVAGAPAPASAGTHQTMVLPSGLGRYLAIRAEDAGGNIGPPAVIDLGAAGGPAPAGVSNAPPLPGIATIVGPAQAACAAKSLHVRLHVHGSRIVDVRVYVNGHLRMHRRGHNLRGTSVGRLPRGRFTLKLVEVDSHHRRHVIRRSYRRCARRRHH